MNDGPVIIRMLTANLVYILTIFLFLSACSMQPAQVVSRPQPPSQKIQQHRVSAGETLYSIAWRYGLDHRTLAKYNGISPPFTIYPGQVLSLKPDPRKASSSTGSLPKAKPKVTEKPSVSPSNTSDSSSANPQGRPKNKTDQAVNDPEDESFSGPPNWRWPARGKVIAGFAGNSGLNQGIDIQGNLGEPVEAAADGRVVYAGSGLRGYGNLVIIKHNDTFLSAYAHNRSLNVAEGQRVKAGQNIAEMGRSGSNKTKLHFEIRRNGEPVNPMRYLPKR